MNLGERKPSSKTKEPHRLEFITRFFMLLVRSVPSPGTRGSQIHGLSSLARHEGVTLPREQQHPNKREYRLPVLSHLSPQKLPTAMP